VAILNPEHLFDQADKLAGGGVGRPRQVDIRRAISASYYALFHAVVTAAADLVVGQNNRAEPRYGLVYRSIDHNKLREFCKEVQKQTLPEKYRRYASQGGFGPDIKAFATAVVELQEKRHTADYDPMAQMKQSDAILLTRTARAALIRLQNANADERMIFFTLLLFEPRR
jgi:uncharacterized protein (UPF0332 family)